MGKLVRYVFVNKCILWVHRKFKNNYQSENVGEVEAEAVEAMI